MTKTKTIKVLPANRLVAVEEQGEGHVAVAFEAGDDNVTLGFLLPDDLADQLAGALIERPRSIHAHHASEPSKDQPCLVRDVEVLPPEDELFVIRLAVDDGPSLTFRMGSRQVERWRNLLTAQIARHEKKSQH